MIEEKTKECFTLMQEIRVDDGIVDADVFHFDETGCVIGDTTSSMTVNSTEVILQVEYFKKGSLIYLGSFSTSFINAVEQISRYTQPAMYFESAL